jgi:metal-responsive CopG/Arc/MetJ family transcriptional regulator
MSAATSPIVPQGVGDTRPLSIRFPSDLIKRLDACALATDNSRSEVIVYLVRWGLDEYKAQGDGKTK